MRVTFFVYIIVLSLAIFHHELWGDEIHSWNIAKGSSDFINLISNTRYEGHPPLWYIILWSVSKFSHNLLCIQIVQLLIAVAVIYLLLFRSPFPLSVKLLLPFGYYFLFEYAVLSRNYAAGILLGFCICLILKKEFRYKLILYYVLLFCMSNTHLLAMLLAGSLHLYFLLGQKKRLTLHILLGILIFLPSLYFIFPPSDSALNTGFFAEKWQMKQQLMTIIQAPLRAFMPIPAWWNYHFWNTQFLLELQKQVLIVKFITPLFSLFLLIIAILTLKKSKKSVLLFTVNLLLTFIIASVFPLTSVRYVGFIFVGFIMAYWLACEEGAYSRRPYIHLLLVFQLAAGIFAVSRDIQYPFSNSYQTNALLKEVPPNERIVTDYWCLNTLSAYADKPFYCIDLNRDASFLMWNREFVPVINRKNPYYKGLIRLFEKEKIPQVYMITIHSPEDISLTDPQLSNYFHLELIDKRDNAIEKWSNLYLYRINMQ